VSVVSDKFFNRTIYICLLSATVAVQTPDLRYSKTQPVQFSAERIWNWRWKTWI